MNSKYIRIGCIILSLILFLFTGWLRIKGDYKYMWQSVMGEMVSEFSYYMEELESYGDWGSMLGESLDVDLDIFDDVEKFIHRIEDGKLTPMEVGLMAPKIGDIVSGMNMLMGSYVSSDLDDVEMVLNVYAVLFWIALVLGIAALLTAFLGKGKVWNVFYLIVIILVWVLFTLVCKSVNDSAGESIMGTGFWSVLAIITAVAALCVKSNSAAVKTAGVPPYTMSGMNGSYNPVGYQPVQLQGWTCPTCGVVQKEESRFCAACGTPKPQPQPIQPVQPQGWTCPTCRAVQNEESRFCAACGTPKPQPQPVQPVQPQGWICPNCGKLQGAEFRFCATCGTPQSTMMPKPEPAPILRPEPIAEPEPAPVLRPEPIAEPEPAPVLRPEPMAEPEPAPVLSPEPMAEPEPVPVLRPEPMAEPEPAPVLRPEPIAEPEPAPILRPEPIAEAPILRPVPMEEPEPRPIGSFCRVCGAKLLPEDKFCSECGSPR